MEGNRLAMNWQTFWDRTLARHTDHLRPRHEHAQKQSCPERRNARREAVVVWLAEKAAGVYTYAPPIADPDTGLEANIARIEAAIADDMTRGGSAFSTQPVTRNLTPAPATSAGGNYRRLA